ncbi:MAG: NYN domain-containing protein [Lachnospiraceae bacterium]|nr:NYN domain-containing protein [Lachnospiraceae bacterium]
MEEILQNKLEFAVLIDSENISSKYAAVIFDELEKYGFASCRRIYGNWSRATGWREEDLLEYSIIPIQQFSYTSKKNSTDMAMVIDAMDLLYKDKVDGFCLVTSDSDFTRLAMRIREEKKFVLGMGESKAPTSLTRSCNKFVYLNLIGEESHQQDFDHNDLESVTPLDSVKKAIAALFAEKGSKVLDLGYIGQRLSEKFTDFDVRNYGYAKLSVFLKEEMSQYQVKRENNQTVLREARQVSQDNLETEIKEMIRENGGSIDNLSIINDEIGKRHPDLELKAFGYSRISSFLRRIKGLEVNNNSVSIKDKTE